MNCPTSLLCIISSCVGEYHNLVIELRHFILHCLCSVSLYLTVGVLYHAVNLGINHSLFNVYCGISDEIDGQLLQWGNLFYISKYWELLDTIFVVLRKKPLTFLHIYHHIIVVFTCWYAVKVVMLMGWITVFNNASIHVVMYYYYGVSALGEFQTCYQNLEIIFILHLSILICFRLLFFLQLYCYILPRSSCTGCLIVTMFRRPTLLEQTAYHFSDYPVRG